MKNKIVQDSITLRNAFNQMDNFKREIVNISTSFQMAKRENEELRGEN